MNKLSEKLKQLDKNELIEFIAQLHSETPELKQRIELLASKHSATEQISLLKKRVQSLKRGTRYIDYRTAHQFGNELYDLVNHIAELVKQKHAPQAVFELVDGFMQSHGNTFERVDDSSGFVGDLYQQGAELWLKAASELHQQQAGAKSTKTSSQNGYDWPKELLKRFNDNGYAAWDDLLKNSAILLTSDELEQLAWRFENDIHTAQQNPPSAERYNSAAAHAKLGLEGVAIALNNPELIEKSTLLISPSPNELQKLSLAQTLLELGHAQRALNWLNGDWNARFQSEQQKLLDACYQATGDKNALLQLRRERYEAQPDANNLQALLAISSPQEIEDLKMGAIQKAQSIEHFSLRINTLIALEAVTEAANEVMLAGCKLSEVGYYVLPDWAKSFAKHNQPLAATLCYRTLTDDILNAARSKAYHHAVNYLKKLCELAPFINDYQGHSQHHDYVNQLSLQHKRKTAFWAKIDFNIPC